MNKEKNLFLKVFLIVLGVCGFIFLLTFLIPENNSQVVQLSAFLHLPLFPGVILQQQLTPATQSLTIFGSVIILTSTLFWSLIIYGILYFKKNQKHPAAG